MVEVQHYTAEEWNKKRKIDIEKEHAATKKAATTAKAKREAADKAKPGYMPPSGNADKTDK